MASYDVYAKEWEEHDGKLVTIDGLRCKLRVTSHEAIYPYPHRVLNVRAEPTRAAKRTEAYLRVKRELRDDWSTDVLESSIELQCEILEQLVPVAHSLQPM